ncbi:MAG: 7,8-didemethyl-8-hydroxy-5-deazariboflavin synthase CofG [Rhodobacteraceae bacterium]|nr:7,8-didemethyl-8-hydroxy-5-deazariboflavin synthase CofG [Paracoccaceae bacterium]
MSTETLSIVDANSFENATGSALSELMARACVKRAAHWGSTATYSRKVFVPLTNMCRDTCTYCSFVKTPDDPAANYMTPEQVLATARQGEATGCKELLFSLGERPELRYPEAAAALKKLGHKTTNEYLRDMCALVLAETTLLPHVNAGTLTDDEIDMLKPVSASMGMMLETVSRRLTRKGMPHYACPDKTPVQRLRTLERAGERGVPFTTGLLIGIGETWAERVESLAAINAAHARHGHIQEVIIQNFQQKPGIGMANHPEPTVEDMLRTLAVARLMLAPEISLQAPPNLSSRHAEYLKAGMNDWGGISPVTVDFINPDHAWPQIDELAKATAEAGLTLQERLTIYPEFLKKSDRFLDPSLTARLTEMARDDGLARHQCLGDTL